MLQCNRDKFNNKLKFQLNGALLHHYSSKWPCSEPSVKSPCGSTTIAPMKKPITLGKDAGVFAIWHGSCPFYFQVAETVVHSYLA